MKDVEQEMKTARRRRSTNKTSMNATSSRSHFIVRIELIQGTNLSKLHLVDLAGSERIDRSKVSRYAFVETKHINKSLAALGNVFYALEHNRHHLPYRDSKLTHFLKQSIGGQAKTFMYVTVSNYMKDRCETVGTLQFGKRVGNVVLSDALSDEKYNRLRLLELQLQDAENEIEMLTAQVQN